MKKTPGQKTAGTRDMDAPQVGVAHHVIILSKCVNERYSRGRKIKRVEWWVRAVNENGKHIEQEWFKTVKDATEYQKNLLEKYPI